jgi:hypothetical protein
MAVNPQILRRKKGGGQLIKASDFVRQLLQRVGSWIRFAENIDWTRLWWVVGVVLSVWIGLVTLLPPQIYKPVAVILAALQSGFLFAARGSKYVKERIDPPQEGGRV